MSVKPVASAAAIVPFWNRLPQVILYPAHGVSLLVIGVLALAYLALFIPFGFFLVPVAAVVMCSYAFECMQATADGALQPPQIGTSFGPSLGRKFCLLIFILAVIVALVKHYLGPMAGQIMSLLFDVSLPGATMTLAMEQSLSEALDPLKWITIMFRIGWPYLALIALNIAISQSAASADLFLVKFLPKGVALFAVGFVANYVAVMNFHLMGYLLYQSHEELGFTPTAPQLSQKAVNADPDQDVLDQAAERVRDGKPEQAVELLRATVRRGCSPVVHAQYRKLLRLTDSKKELLDHDRDYITSLIGEQKDRLAIEFLCECQGIDPGFAPDTAFQITQLAIIAAKMGQPRAALQLVAVFNERFPKSQYAVDNGLLAATLMHEHLSQDEQALGVLKELKATVAASDPRLVDIDTKIAAIERIMAATKKPVGAKPLGAI